MLWIVYLYLIQKHPSCKKSVWSTRRPLWKKMWNPRWQPRNSCDGRLIAKILMMTIQVNLVPNYREMWRRQHKFTWIFVFKIFAISLLSQPFLGCHLGFHIFFHTGLLVGCTLLFTAAVLHMLIMYTFLKIVYVLYMSMIAGLLKVSMKQLNTHTCSSFQYKDTPTINRLLSNFPPSWIL